MKATVQIHNPDQVNVTVTLTMPVGSWRRLLNQLPPSDFPAWQLSTVIRRLIAVAEEKVTEPFEVEP